MFQLLPVTVVPGDFLARPVVEADHMLDLPGAHPRERQRQDAARHNKPLGEWLEAFFDEWLATAGALNPSANRVA